MNYSNTDRMYYNLNKHRYILRPTAIEQSYGIQLLDVLDSDSDISPETLPERYLERVSMVLYMYVYSWCVDKSKTEYVLSLPNNRETIEDAMCELCYAWLLNNTDPSVYFTGDTLKTIEVPPAVQTILMDNGLLFRGDYVNLPQNWQSGRGTDY